MLSVEDREGGRGRGATYILNPAILSVFDAAKGGQGGRVSDAKTGQKRQQTKKRESPVIVDEKTKRRHVNPDRVAAEGKKEEKTGEALPFLDRLRQGGAAMKCKGQDLTPEWESLAASSLWKMVSRLVNRAGICW